MVERAWGEGAWGDILPEVFEFLPPQERFTVQRVSKLFQQASEKSRLAVGELQLELTDIHYERKEGKEFKFVGKILDPDSSDGITSLIVPSPVQRSVCYEYTECPKYHTTVKKEKLLRLEESRRQCEEVLGKLSLPTLSHVSLCTGPLTQSLLPFLRSHPSISSVRFRIVETCVSPCNWYCDTDFKEGKMLCEGLSQAKIRKLTLFLDHGGAFERFKEFGGTTLLENIEELWIGPPYPADTRLLPNIAQLKAIKYDLRCEVHHADSNVEKICSSLVRGESGLRRIAFTSWTLPFIRNEFKAVPLMQKLSLESHIGFMILTREHCAVLRAFIETLASGRESCNLAQNLQELTISVCVLRKLGRVSMWLDMSMFDTDAFLRFPRLHSLRLRVEVDPDAFEHVRNPVSYEELSVIAELNRRLRVLEIPVLLPEAEGTSLSEIRAALRRKLVPFLDNAPSVEGGAAERKFTWLPVFRPATGQGHFAGHLKYDHNICPMTVEGGRRKDEGWAIKKILSSPVEFREPHWGFC